MRLLAPKNSQLPQPYGPSSTDLGSNPAVMRPK
jgi:hypothetical protein